MNTEEKALVEKVQQRDRIIEHQRAGVRCARIIGRRPIINEQGRKTNGMRFN